MSQSESLLQVVAAEFLNLSCLNLLEDLFELLAPHRFHDFQCLLDEDTEAVVETRPLHVHVVSHQEHLELHGSHLSCIVEFLHQ